MSKSGTEVFLFTFACYHGLVFRPALVGAVLAAASLTALCGAGPDKKADILTGRLDYLFTESPKGPEIVWSMVHAGKRVTLELPTEIVQSAGGLTGLAGRKVTLSGRLFGTTFQVEKIGWSRDSMTPDPRRVDPTKPVTEGLSGTLPQILILAKFSDDPAEPHEPSWYENFVVGPSAPSLRDYYLELSYGKWDLAGSKATTWVTLPHPKAYYQDDSPTQVRSEAIVMDALAAADSQVDFRQFDGFHVMANAMVGSKLGGDGGVGTYTLDGETRAWKRTYNNQSAAPFRILAHELGHTFGFDHSYGGYDLTYDSRWDVMSAGGTWARYDDLFGIIPPHTNQYHRIVRGLTPRDLIADCMPGTDKTISLTRPVRPEPGKAQVARIFIDGDHWITVEARRRIGYYEFGESIPDEGIVLHDVSSSHTFIDQWTGQFSSAPMSHVIDVDGNGDCNDAASVWKPGETYTDAANGITIAVVKSTADGYDVRVKTAPGKFSLLTVTNGNDRGPGSLRSAISYANLFPGTIRFAAPKSALTNGELLIQPVTPLPSITGDKIRIDGTTQTALGDTNPGMPEVAIDGSKMGGNGLLLEGQKITLKGLAVRNMSSVGFYLWGAADAYIEGCVTGLDRTGSVAAPNGWGVALQNGSDRAIFRDLVSSGNNYGFYVDSSDNLKIQGGLFGTDAKGATALPNSSEAFLAYDLKNLSFSPSDARRCVISASGGYGLYAAGCQGVKLTGVYVGTGLTGKVALGNRLSGVWLNGSTKITLSDSVFSGNGVQGLYISSADAVAASIAGCRFGTNASGTAALGNGQAGALVEAPGVSFSDCLASGNAGDGIAFRGLVAGTVKGCKVGTDLAGKKSLGNANGIVLNGTASARVSDSLVAGNREHGLFAIEGASKTVVSGSRFGVGSEGEKIPGGGAGIRLERATSVKITSCVVGNQGSDGVYVESGTLVTMIGGRIDSCGGAGIRFTAGAVDSGVTGAEVRGCAGGAVAISGEATKRITVRGILADGNMANGIVLASGANTCTLMDNVVLNYTECGILLNNAHLNTVVGNAVGCALGTPTAPLHQGWAGISVSWGAYGNLIGKISDGNTIAGGGQIGVAVVVDETNGNQIRGNAIYPSSKLGIDLGGDGPDKNDTTDGDNGPNRRQNSPTLARSKTDPTKIEISYQGAAKRTIYVDLYAVDAGQAKGSGPGQKFLRTITLKTSATGAAKATIVAPANVTVITAVATDASNGDSGEFAKNLALP